MDCCNKKTLRSEEDKKLLINRMNRIVGQLNGIKNMIENDEYCVDILTQLAASQAGIRSLANLLIDKHMHSCVVRDIKEGKEDTIDEVLSNLRRFQWKKRYLK